ncbi:uncharacterized protein VTP21DRAFT_9082 [Calcarisporiella thermophila]|uniref:uncharacterized protein n=1 Tax=Calcarisporiella thermophila TaxID=911321 RepID=UPI00374234D3
MSTPTRAVNRNFTSTTFEFPGYTIAQIHGVVRGITVRNPNIGKAFVATLASIGGGENSGYLEMAEKARETAFQRLLEHAAAAGGNAVLGIRYDANEIMEGMTEVLAYGTAVTLVPINQPTQPSYGSYKY